MLQLAPQPPGLDAHDRIELRIEGPVAPEHLNADGIGLDAVLPAFQRLLDDIGEEIGETIGASQLGTGEDALKLPLDIGRPDISGERFG